MTILDAFLTSDAGLALKGLLVVAFLDFITGTFAAFRDGTFALDAVAAFVRKHILGRVAPIASLLTVGYFGGSAGQMFIAFGVAAAAAYVAETVGSVKGNLLPPKAGDGELVATAVSPDATVADVAVVGPANPVPTE